MKFKVRFKAPRINFQRYSQELRDELTDKIALAAFAWLDATTDKIPQWSGASAATFLHLAREVNFSLPISEATLAPNRVSLGLRESDGGITLDPHRGRFTFSYSTTLEHLIFNEFNNANITHDPKVFSRLLNPGPYQFQAKGKAAFLRVASSVRLPDPFRFLSIKTFKVG